MLYIRNGYYSSGDVIYNFDGRYIRAGYYSSGDVLYNVDGRYIRAGYYSSGDIVYNIDGNYVRVGCYSSGDVKYNIDGKYIRLGYYKSGEVIYNITEENTASGCFITTACIKSKGLPVGCYELETLRKFRDSWVSNHENGPEEIQIYYEIAPKIVDKLNQIPDSKEIYDKIYRDVVLQCVRMIEDGNEQDAYFLYKNASLSLKKYTDNL